MATELIACGASLGGLAALQFLLPRLPKQLGAPFLIVQHRRANGSHHLRRLLQKHCQRKVIEPEDQEPLEKGCVYLAPADYHMMVGNGRLELSQDAPVHFSRPSIDVLFESVADAYGPRALALVLTASSEDGAQGAWRIKEAGGKVIVQDPEEAESPVGIQATLEKTAVDCVARLEEIPDLLLRLHD